MAELDGDGNPVYSNDRYLFPYFPPYILKKTSAQVYTKKLNIKKDDLDILIQVEGIDNAYYIFVNQEFVGFANISHAVFSLILPIKWWMEKMKFGLLY